MSELEAVAAAVAVTRPIAPNVIPLVAHECEWFLKAALELYEEFGTSISGCVIMLRIDKGSDNPLVGYRQSWKNVSELIGQLHIHAHQLTNEYYPPDE